LTICREGEDRAPSGFPFSILERKGERLAVGFVSARVMESTFIAVGILSMLALVTLR
jgi:hypothetical protein